MYSHFLKRVIDFLLVFCILALIWPILFLVAFWLHFANKGSGVFFTQERPGKEGKIFKVIKFKTMTDERDAEGNLLPDAVRLTKVGSFVRSTSIDELPQLINILRGDMALIGPRPALTYHPWSYDQYDEHQKHMFDVLPGVTGWAQVNGRKEVPWPERIELNVWYAQHMNFSLDLKIFFMTIFKVVTNANNENVSETSVKK